MGTSGLHWTSIVLIVGVYFFRYGGFNISLLPSFSVSRLVFVKHFDAVFAIANLRGGGTWVCLLRFFSWSLSFYYRWVWWWLASQRNQGTQTECTNLGPTASPLLCANYLISSFLGVWWLSVRFWIPDFYELLYAIDAINNGRIKWWSFGGCYREPAPGSLCLRHCPGAFQLWLLIAYFWLGINRDYFQRSVWWICFVSIALQLVMRGALIMGMPNPAKSMWTCLCTYLFSRLVGI